MNIRLKDIAEKCGVSINTVSHILNRDRGDLYDQKLVARIKKTAAAMNYKPSRAAQSLVLNRSRIIGFVVLSDASDGQVQHYNEYPFLLGLSHELYKQSYHTMLVEMKELGGEELPALLRDRIFDGLIIHAGYGERLTSMLSRIDIPMIFWDCGLFSETDSIDRNERTIARRLVEELISLGHTRIAFHAGSVTAWKRYTSGGESHFSYAARYESYRDVTASRGLKENIMTGYDIGTVASQLSSMDSTAVVTLGDSVIPRIIMAAQTIGRSVPKDISIAVFDRNERITTGGALIPGGAPYDRYAAGEQAGCMLLRKIAAGKPVPSAVLPAGFDHGETISNARS
ncbi:MAG: LacI family DNA-binding transcriptional regulator [Spirochaetota bacterium]